MNNNSPTYSLISPTYILKPTLPSQIKLQRDISAFMNSSLSNTSSFKVVLSPCFYSQAQLKLFFYAEINSLFKLIISYSTDYPFSAPSIAYFSGVYNNDYFDMEDNLRIEFVNVESIFNVKTVIFAIEMMLSSKDRERKEKIDREEIQFFGNDFGESWNHKKKFYQFEEDKRKNIRDCYLNYTGGLSERKGLKRVKI